MSCPSHDETGVGGYRAVDHLTRTGSCARALRIVVALLGGGRSIPLRSLSEIVESES